VGGRVAGRIVGMPSHWLIAPSVWSKKRKERSKGAVGMMDSCVTTYYASTHLFEVEVAAVKTNNPTEEYIQSDDHCPRLDDSRNYPSDLDKITGGASNHKCRKSNLRTGLLSVSAYRYRKR
jgi:hypothetical protein